jgi:hypothetical protein
MHIEPYMYKVLLRSLAMKTRSLRSSMPLLVTVIAACVVTLLSLSKLGKPVVTPTAVPAQFVGTWTVTGVNGQPLGRAMLTADGRYDDGDSRGTWAIENGVIELRTWEKTPSSWIRYIFPNVSQTTLVPGRDGNSEVTTLESEWAVSVRQSARN